MCSPGQHQQLRGHHSVSVTLAALLFDNGMHNFMLRKRPWKEPDNVKLGKWESGEEVGEGSHLLKTHETWNFHFAIKEERGSVKM